FHRFDVILGPSTHLKLIISGHIGREFGFCDDVKRSGNGLCTKNTSWAVIQSDLFQPGHPSPELPEPQRLLEVPGLDRRMLPYMDFGPPPNVRWVAGRPFL